MNIKRKAEERLVDLLKSHETNRLVIFVEGARQVGKTTCVQNVLSRFSDTVSVNLETNKILRLKIDETKSFRELIAVLKNEIGFNPETKQVLFIDEAQESDQLGSYVRSFKEKLTNTRVILSGSSMKRIFREGTRIPVGRTIRIKVNPFSFEEFLTCRNQAGLIDFIQEFTFKKQVGKLIHKELLAQLDCYTEVGGLPAVAIAAAESQDYRIIRTNIFLDQEEDFVNKEKLIKKDLFRAVLSGVSNHLGYPSKYSQMGNDDKAAKSVISLLKAWHLVLEVEQKGDSSTTKFYPKRYLYDTGMVNYLRNMPFAKLSLLATSDQALRISLGGIFENLVLLALSEAKLGLVDISSWKKGSQDRAEVDFVWRDEIVVPIECKASLKLTERSFNSVKEYLQISKQPLGIVVSAAPFSMHNWNGKTLVNLPLYLVTPDIIKGLIGKIIG